MGDTLHLQRVGRAASVSAVLAIAAIAGGLSTACALSQDDTGQGDIEVTLIGNLPNTHFAKELGPRLSPMTVVQEATHPSTAPVLINADAFDGLKGDTLRAIRDNYRAGRPVVLLNAAQHHADALANFVGHPRAPQLFFYAEDGRRRTAVAVELEPDGHVQYVLRGDDQEQFAAREVSLFLKWLDDDGSRIGQRLYEREVERVHGPFTDISQVPDEAELEAHGEHEQTTHQFAGEAGELSLTTTSVTAYSCSDSHYHTMVLAHLEGAWANSAVTETENEDEIELIQLSRHIPGGELLAEPLVHGATEVNSSGFNLSLDRAAFVLNDNRGTSVFAPVVTHLAKWTVQETEVPMGDGEAGSHLWTLKRKTDEPLAFSYTTGWKWLFPLEASSGQMTVTAPLGARMGADQRDFTLTFKGPVATLCE
jgi:hypothetical protein